MENVYEWFVYNSVEVNPVTFQFIILGNTASDTLKIRDITIKLVSSVTLLGL